MDHKLCGLLRHCVLVHVILQFHWRLVFSAPIGCIDLNNTKDITLQLQGETIELRDAYNQFHGEDDLISRDVLNATVTGDTVSEKLRDVYAKSVLMRLHILKVKEYQVEFGGDQMSVTKNLEVVQLRLNYHLNMGEILKNLYPEVPLPPTPAPLQLSANHLFDKKKYGWDVIFTLEAWLKQVLQVPKEICDGQMAGV